MWSLYIVVYLAGQDPAGQEFSVFQLPAKTKARCEEQADRIHDLAAAFPDYEVITECEKVVDSSRARGRRRDD